MATPIWMKTTSAPARVVAALIALVAWAALIIQYGASYAGQGSLIQSLWSMALYLTIITNFLAALIFMAVAAGNVRLGSPRVLGGAALTLLLVGIVYGLLLRGIDHLVGAAITADFLLHTAMPILVPLFWLIFAQKGTLGRFDPTFWCILPLVYLFYALVRGATGGRYPYFFLDLGKLGWEQTAINAVGISVGYIAFGFGLVALDALLGRRRENGVEGSAQQDPLALIEPQGNEQSR